MTDEDYDPGSISIAILALEDSDESAAQKIWDRFFTRLCQYARTRVYTRHRHVFDEEDVAASAFFALCEGIREDRFGRVRNRDDLWRLLTVLAANKACSARRAEDAQKRGSGQVLPESALDEDTRLMDFLDGAVDPAIEAEFENTLEQLVDQLKDRGDYLAEVVMMKLAGHTREEIAERIECSTKTVDRKLGRIREEWTKLNRKAME